MRNYRVPRYAEAFLAVVALGVIGVSCERKKRIQASGPDGSAAVELLERSPLLANAARAPTTPDFEVALEYPGRCSAFTLTIRSRGDAVFSGHRRTAQKYAVMPLTPSEVALTWSAVLSSGLLGSKTDDCQTYRIADATKILLHLRISGTDRKARFHEQAGPCSRLAGLASHLRSLVPLDRWLGSRADRERFALECEREDSLRGVRL